MSEDAKSSTWGAFCDYLSSYAGQHDNFVLVTDGERLPSDTLNAIPENKIFRSAASTRNMILNAAGLALNGKKPWIAGNSADLISRSYGQIRETLAIPSLPVRLVVADGGFSDGQEGASSNVLEDMALMRAMPGMTIFAPSDAPSVKKIADVAANLNAPVYMRLSVTRDVALASSYDDDHIFRDGGARVLRSGNGITICACGIMVEEAMKAAATLEKQGINAEVIDCYSIKPFPAEPVIASVRRTGCCVTAEEHSIVGGLYSALSEALCGSFQAPVRAVAVEDVFVSSGTPEELREYYGLTSKEIISAAAQVWALRRR